LRDQIGYVLTGDGALSRICARQHCLWPRRRDRGGDYEAAKLANADEFIARMPNGYQTFVGDRAIPFPADSGSASGLRRAIIRNNPNSILDEPTAALDTESERLVIEALERLMKGRTTLTIAHRLSTIRDADKNHCAERWCSGEQGTHDQLWRWGEPTPSCIVYSSIQPGEGCSLAASAGGRVQMSVV